MALFRVQLSWWNYRISIKTHYEKKQAASIRINGIVNGDNEFEDVSNRWFHVDKFK